MTPGAATATSTGVDVLADHPTLPRLNLVRTRALASIPDLDAEQREVVAHRGSALLVLAGPGTGKTTTLVEAMVDRLMGADACERDQVLGLTFAAKAAQEWRDRVAIRLGGAGPQVTTFHSYAFSLVRKHADALRLQGPPRLLAGYEEQSTVHEIVQAALQVGRIPFPEDLRVAVLTTEFGRQLRSAMARARAVGLDAEHLHKAAGDDPAWVLAANLLQQYESYLEDRDAFDYSSLVVAATAAVQSPKISRSVHSRLRAVFVDEYQDTDPAQVQLLRAIVGPGCDVTVVGDPDQAIYAFRGADVGAIFGFADTFGLPGRPARTVVLRTCRRFGPELRALADVGIAKVQYPGVLGWSQMREQHRRPECVGGGRQPGPSTSPEHVADVVLCASPRVEAAAVAERIARLHQQGHSLAGVVVLVRNSEQIPALARACIASGIAVDIDGDEQPVVANGAVSTLLEAALLVDDPQGLNVPVAYALLYSPLCGADPADVRALIREIRLRQRREDPGAVPTSSDDIVVALVRDRAALAVAAGDRAGDVLQRLRAWHDRLDAARSVRSRGGSPAEVLWSLWSGSGNAWPNRLRAVSLRGGAAGRQADRDLDAVMTLFEMAAKASHTKAKSVARFVEEVRAQGIGVAPVGSAAVVERVRIMTAHRAKGLEWDHVFVCGVQDGVWPNLRPRGGMLAADRVTAEGLDGGLTPVELLAEERRLFYVALTRARRRVWVTAVDAGHTSDAAARPSVFVRELLAKDADGALVARIPGVAVRTEQRQSVRTLSMPDVVARLREVVSDADQPESRRVQAAAQLARLAHIPGSGADPGTWWGLHERSQGTAPVRPDGPLRLSGTALKDISDCSLRWFLEREVAAGTEKTTALVFGSLVHTLCEQVALHPEVAPDIPALIDEVWPRVSYDAAWISKAQRIEVGEAMQRFLHWHREQSAAGRRTGGVEARFDTTITVDAPGGGVHEIRLTGSMDRVEVGVSDAGTHVTVYDFKTNSEHSVPSPAEVAQHIQLLTYQAVVREGALAEVGPIQDVDAGLVFLRVAEGSTDGPKVKTQRAADAGGAGRAHFDAVVDRAATAIRSEAFTATPGKHCAFCPLQSACPAKVFEGLAGDVPAEAGADAD